MKTIDSFFKKELNEEDYEKLIKLLNLDFKYCVIVGDYTNKLFAITPDHQLHMPFTFSITFNDREDEGSFCYDFQMLEVEGNEFALYEIELFDNLEDAQDFVIASLEYFDFSFAYLEGFLEAYRTLDLHNVEEAKAQLLKNVELQRLKEQRNSIDEDIKKLEKTLGSIK